MINIHTHIFNGKYTPEYFLLEHAPNKFAAKQIRKMLNGGPLTQKIALALIKNMGTGAKMIAFVKMGIRKEMEEIFKVLAEESGYPAHTRFVVLPINFEYMGGGDCDISYEQQLKDILYKVKQHHRNTCLPFVHIDPRAEDTGAKLAAFAKRYLVRGFVGIKLYPSLGYYPYDPKLKEVYAYAQENELPIMTHCSRGGINYIGNSLIQFYSGISFNPKAPCLLPYGNNPPEPKYVYPTNIKVNAKFCDFFLDPENYVDALELFPKLKICFAHFGSDEEINKKLGTPPRNDTWYDKVISLLKKYPNTVADISYTLHMPKFRKLVLDDMEMDLKQNPITATDPITNRLVSKVLYGTDFYMAYQEDNCTEAGLYNDAFRDFNSLQNYPELSKLGIGTLWQMMTKDNCTRYLTSQYYKA